MHDSTVWFRRSGAGPSRSGRAAREEAGAVRAGSRDLVGGPHQVGANAPSGHRRLRPPRARGKGPTPPLRWDAPGPTPPAPRGAAAAAGSRRRALTTRPPASHGGPAPSDESGPPPPRRPRRARVARALSGPQPARRVALGRPRGRRPPQPCGPKSARAAVPAVAPVRRRQTRVQHDERIKRGHQIFAANRGVAVLEAGPGRAHNRLTAARCHRAWRSGSCRNDYGAPPRRPSRPGPADAASLSADSSPCTASLDPAGNLGAVGAIGSRVRPMGSLSRPPGAGRQRAPGRPPRAAALVPVAAGRQPGPTLASYQEPGLRWAGLDRGGRPTMPLPEAGPRPAVLSIVSAGLACPHRRPNLRRPWSAIPIPPARSLNAGRAPASPSTKRRHPLPPHHP